MYKYNYLKKYQLKTLLNNILKIILFVYLLSLPIIFIIVQNNQNKTLESFLEYVESNEFHPLILTAYNSHINQTDHTPHITASGRKTSYQTIALSRDFIKKYNYPECKGLNYGDTVTIIMRKQFIIEDTMNKRYKNRGDIWVKDKTDALQFGINDGLLIIKKKK